MTVNTTKPKDILVSIRPQYVSKILCGEKTVELRRRFPDTGVTGATVFIYSSSPTSALVARATIKDVKRLSVSKIWKSHSHAACIAKADFHAYFDGADFGYAIHLTAVRPMPHIGASHLRAQFGIVPPQSYRYVAGDFYNLISDEQLQATGRYKHNNSARGPAAGTSFAG